MLGGRGGGPSAGTGVSWVGCRHPRRRELPPPSETLSSVFLHFQDDCATQNKLRIKFGKKRTEGFLVLLLPRLPRVVVGFTYDRGSWHNPWGQCGEEVSFLLVKMKTLFLRAV